MKPSFLPNTGKVRTRVACGLFRAFTFILLIAAFAFTSAHAQVVAYVVSSAGSDPSGNFVSVIDTATNTVTATISLPNPDINNELVRALGAVVSPDGSRLYVGDIPFVPHANIGHLYVIDTS